MPHVDELIKEAEKIAARAQDPKNTDAHRALTAFIADMQTGVDPGLCAKMLYYKLGGRAVEGIKYYY